MSKTKSPRISIARTMIGDYTISLMEDGSLRIHHKPGFELFAGRAFPRSSGSKGGSIEIRPVVIPKAD